MRESIRRRLERLGFRSQDISYASTFLDEDADFDSHVNFLTMYTLRLALTAAGFREIAPNTWQPDMGQYIPNEAKAS